MSITIPKKNSPDSEFEVLWQLCRKIGSGTTRDVYDIPDHDLVLKVVKVPSHLTNWNEIVLYQMKSHLNELGEISSWSRSGKFLVMEKLRDLDKTEWSRYTIPSYLTDRKIINYGKNSSGVIKARDYGTIKRR
ncbi:hypothetical protein DFP83_11531 [Idiomarina fontislapidosi]|uniref:Serine/threonine protein kinase n=1 Tax=Idiomarina fontislapidosi TaxID=263723 RepID=A0A432XP33_9GAMM|nr:hypothetical protein [Idiomarina fontislapidosi]PYE30593.1 hypothetical protein DFP83_11531 [Idiomarina fontislapidosi]RUO50485.1 hypothetical protein CWE25_12260 [Idiomarina fontislapidosi]